MYQMTIGMVPVGGEFGPVVPGAGSQFRVPVKSAWLTPAAMKSEIPLPMPHLETTSSIRNTRYEPIINWVIIAMRAHVRPSSPTTPTLGSRKPKTCGMDSTKIITTTSTFWVPW